MHRIAVLTPFLLAAASPPYTAPVGDFLQTWGKDLVDTDQPVDSPPTSARAMPCSPSAAA